MPIPVIPVIITAAAIIAAGAWLRWACTPLMLAFHIGRRAERIASRRQGGQP